MPSRPNNFLRLSLLWIGLFATITAILVSLLGRTYDIKPVTSASSSLNLILDWAGRVIPSSHSMPSINPEAQSKPSAVSDNSVDSDSFHPRSSNTNEESTSSEPLGLLEDGPTTAQEATKLEIGKGGQVSLDALGPMIVNPDGSLSRIANWDRMTEIEKKSTLRVIGKRNEKRLEALRSQTAADD